MHGAVHDYVVLKTVVGADEMHSGETHDPLLVKEIADYRCKLPTEQPRFPRVLEIGSLDINGSQAAYSYLGHGPRWVDQIGCEEYIGLDLIEGAGVSLVANAHDIPLEEGSFDLVLSMNMLEHDSDPQATISEAYRVLRKGGTMLLTTVNQEWGEHAFLGGGDTETYNRITLAQFAEWIAAAGFKGSEVIEWRANLFCSAVK